MMIKRMLKKIIKSNIDKGQDQGLMKEDIGNIRKREVDLIQKKKSNICKSKILF